ncbi:U3 snoRNP protein [Ascosphaera acerosa]|nr:U3 snoRNP protein [Ascosphaera acerosa]
MSQASSASMPTMPTPDLIHTLSQTPETYLTPTPSIAASWAQLAKQYTDLLAADVSAAQTARQAALRRAKKSRKRKHGDGDYEDDDDEEERDAGAANPLRIKEVHADGFTVRQIWEQIHKVLKAGREDIARDALRLAEADLAAAGEGEDHDEPSEGDGAGEEDFAGLSDQSDVEKMGESGEEEGEGASDIDDEDMTAIDDYEEETEHDEQSKSQSKSKSKAKSKTSAKPDPFGLNDGFFSLDEFNAQSAMFERKDARTIENDDEDDEERINWEADPNATGGMEGLEDDDEEEEEDEEDEGMDMDGMIGVGGNANDIMYDDFFGPPDPTVAKRRGEKRKEKEAADRLATEARERELLDADESGAESEAEQQASGEDGDDGEGSDDEETVDAAPEHDESEEERDIERAISDVRRDLFDDEEEDDDEEDEGDLSSSDERGGRSASSGPQSTHERAQLKLMDEIRKLEAANVAKREWALSGEAEAHERPVNSLIEEDLEFERVGKPVPVISAEVSEDIEALVKRRIIAHEFDEVVRRRPGLDAAAANRSRPAFVLEETKSQKSLGELYEADFQRANDPNYVDQRSEKTKREHAEITALWKELAGQLDVLTSWHHRPAPPQATISVVKDTATIEMEDVRPGMSGTLDEARTLAPQEVYAPGRDGGALAGGEVVLKSGAAVSKDEMSRDEKHRRRRREKRARAKQFVAEKGKAAAAAAAAGGKAADGVSRKEREASEKKQLLADLKQGGVKVIGKAGALTDVTGGKIKDVKADEPRKLKL